VCHPSVVSTFGNTIRLFQVWRKSRARFDHPELVQMHPGNIDTANVIQPSHEVFRVT